MNRREFVQAGRVRRVRRGARRGRRVGAESPRRAGMPPTVLREGEDEGRHAARRLGGDPARAAPRSA